MVAADLVQAARATGLAAQLTESYRGSRVESYMPLFELAAHLCQPEILTAAAAAENDAQPASLLQQTLRLLTAILAGHSKEVLQLPFTLEFLSFMSSKSSQTLMKITAS